MISFIILGLFLTYIFLFLLFTIINMTKFNRLKKKRKQKLKDEIKKEKNVYEYMKSKDLIIAFLVRDSENSIPYIEKIVTKLKKLFKTVQVIALENGSQDNTRKKLLEKNYILYNEGHFNLKEYKTDLDVKIPKNFSEYRIRKMVFLRQDLHTGITQNFSADFVFYYDADIKGKMFKSGILDTFKHFMNRSDIDGVASFSIRQDFSTIYDRYAFVPYYNSKYKIKIYDDQIYTGMIRVYSAYGGACFYRFNEKFKNNKYIYDQDQGKPLCEHVPFNKNLNMYMNTNMVLELYEN